MEPSLIVHRRVLKNVEFFQHFFQYCQHNVEHFKPPTIWKNMGALLTNI